MAKQPDQDVTNSKQPEKIEINIFGMKLVCTSPSARTITILVIFLLFAIVIIVALALLLPKEAFSRWFTLAGVFPFFQLLK